VKLIDPPYDGSYGEEIERLQRVLVGAGYWVSKQAIHDAWRSYSATHAAGWLESSDFERDDIVRILLREFGEEPPVS
jgi:hypothetical protein